MKLATTLSILVLFLIASGHVIRVVAGWPVTVNGFSVPIWFSAIAAVMFAALGAAMIREH